MSSLPYARFGQAVQGRRRELGLSQSELSGKLGISRQNLIEIEAGRRLPQLLLAQQLAMAFGWTLDQLAGFLPAPQASLGLHWAFDPPPGINTPVVWTFVGGCLTVASSGRLTPEFVMDGLWNPASARVNEVAGAADPASTLFVAGCDPFLPWLWQRTPHPDIRLYIFSMGSQSALKALKDGAVHLAGTHLFDEATGQYNRFVERLPFPVRRWQYLHWEEGVMGAAERPENWALREPGSEARALFERHRGIDGQAHIELDSHWAVARYIRSHPNTAGVGLRAVADALNLPFYPWTQEPYEWVTREEWADDRRLKAFQHWLKSPSVMRAIERVPGLTPWDPGSVVR